VPHYRVTLAYDGTGFAGWQRQAGDRGARTVQGTVEAALARLSSVPVAVTAASRTDAGAHAQGQVAAFALERELAPGALLGALNALLPDDVRALEAAAVDRAFHPRRDARSKLYRYELDTGRVRLPTRRRAAGHVPWSLDEAATRAAAALFLGRQDFASLRSAGSSARTTVRTVTRSEAAFLPPPAPGAGPTLVYLVEADGFLRKMVRSMVGGLVEAGRGARSVEDLRRALAAGDRRGWPAPVEACGLTLVRVEYGVDASGTARIT
jgi:tRNA pseudouridine38-40 synthase